MPKKKKAPKPKQARPRTVFGRLRVDFGGKPVKISMTKTHLIVQPLHARKVWALPIQKLLWLVLVESAAGIPTHEQLPTPAEPWDENKR